MEFVDHCEITQVHQGAVDQVRQVLPPDEVLIQTDIWMGRKYRE